MSTIAAQPLKWPGGKSYLAKRIVELMPRHLHYVEPYAGGLAVLFARDPDDKRLWLPPHKGVSEVANDLNGHLINFWTVLRAPDLFEEFRRIVEATPMSRLEWDVAGMVLENNRYSDVERAAAFFVHCRQSRSGAMENFTSITRSRTRRQMNGNVSEWIGAVDGLLSIHARLRRVLIENMPAVKLIKREDTPGTLFYLDPPYLKGKGEARKTDRLYRHDMTREQHVELLETILAIQGKVMLSGYPSDLYSDMLRGWRVERFDIANHLSGSKSKDREVECLWMNFH